MRRLELDAGIVWKKMAERSSELLCTLDRAGMLRFITGVSKKITGYDGAEIADRHLGDLLHPQDLPAMLQALDEIRRGTRSDSFENRLIHKAGHPVPVGWSIAWAGADECYYCVARELIHSNSSSSSSRLSGKQRQAKRNIHFERITDAFFMLDRNWNFTYINQQFGRILDKEQEALLGKNIWEVFPEEVNGEFYQQYHRALETGSAVEFISYYQECDKWLQVKAFPCATGISVYFDDVTDKVTAQRELEKLSVVASHTTNGVIITDKEWRIEWVNEAFSRLTGLSPEEVLDRIPDELLAGNKDATGAYEKLKDQVISGKPGSAEIAITKKTGEPRWLLVQVNPIYNDPGELSRYVIIQTDISDLKKSELELAQLAKDLYRQNSDLQQFTYIVSHNLRAPVANALGLVDLLTKMDKDAEAFEPSLFNLKKTLFQFDTIIRDLNSILSIRDGKDNLEQAPVGILPVINQAITTLQESLQDCGGEVLVDVPASLRVRASKPYLYSIFYNLLSNAIKYRSEERLLQVHIKCLGKSEKGTVITFTDNGSGLDMKKVSGSIFKLYKRFHPTKKGRGIGLYLVKNHIEAMGGQIKATSKLGIGTRFILYLP